MVDTFKAVLRHLLIRSRHKNSQQREVKIFSVVRVRLDGRSIGTSRLVIKEALNHCSSLDLALSLVS